MGGSAHDRETSTRRDHVARPELTSPGCSRSPASGGILALAARARERLRPRHPSSTWAETSPRLLAALGFSLGGLLPAVINFRRDPLLGTGRTQRIPLRAPPQVCARLALAVFAFGGRSRRGSHRRHRAWIGLYALPADTREYGTRVRASRLWPPPAGLHRVPPPPPPRWPRPPPDPTPALTAPPRRQPWRSPFHDPQRLGRVPRESPAPRRS